MQELNINTWPEFKATCIERKGLDCQYEERPNGYTLVGPDSNGIIWLCALAKTDPRNDDQADFEDNYKASFNDKIEPAVLTEPNNLFQMQADAVSAIIPKGTTGIIDYKVVNRPGEEYTVKYLNGAEVKLVNGVDGDWAQCAVVDVENVLGYGAGLVLKTYVFKKFLFPGHVHTVPATAPGAIPINTYLRCYLHSTGTEVDPTLYINFDIEVKG
jgi:hypothetical protein